MEDVYFVSVVLLGIVGRGDHDSCRALPSSCGEGHERGWDQGAEEVNQIALVDENRCCQFCESTKRKK